MKLPERLTQLVTLFSKIPGIGEKTAFRHVLSLLNWDEKELKQFQHAIGELSAIGYCERCGLFSDQPLCSICSDPYRNEQNTICVVEQVTDALAIERSESYRGSYHVLGGVLNPLMGIGPDQIALNSLFERVKGHDNLDLLLAINPTIEGDATCAYIKQQLGNNVSIHRIGFGIPMGSNLDYLDGMTISRALENKKRF